MKWGGNPLVRAIAARDAARRSFRADSAPRRTRAASKGGGKVYGKSISEQLRNRRKENEAKRASTKVRTRKEYGRSIAEQLKAQGVSGHGVKKTSTSKPKTGAKFTMEWNSRKNRPVNAGYQKKTTPRGRAIINDAKRGGVSVPKSGTTVVRKTTTKSPFSISSILKSRAYANREARARGATTYGRTTSPDGKPSVYGRRKTNKPASGVKTGPVRYTPGSKKAARRVSVTMGPRSAPDEGTNSAAKAAKRDAKQQAVIDKISKRTSRAGQPGYVPKGGKKEAPKAPASKIKPKTMGAGGGPYTFMAEGTTTITRNGKKVKVKVRRPGSGPKPPDTRIRGPVPANKGAKTTEMLERYPWLRSHYKGPQNSGGSPKNGPVVRFSKYPRVKPAKKKSVAEQYAEKTKNDTDLEKQRREEMDPREADRKARERAKGNFEDIEEPENAWGEDDLRSDEADETTGKRKKKPGFVDGPFEFEDPWERMQFGEDYGYPREPGQKSSGPKVDKHGDRVSIRWRTKPKIRTRVSEDGKKMSVTEVPSEGRQSRNVRVPIDHSTGELPWVARTDRRGNVVGSKTGNKKPGHENDPARARRNNVYWQLQDEIADVADPKKRKGPFYVKTPDGWKKVLRKASRGKWVGANEATNQYHGSRAARVGDAIESAVAEASGRERPSSARTGGKVYGKSVSEYLRARRMAPKKGKTTKYPAVPNERGARRKPAPRGKWIDVAEGPTTFAKFVEDGDTVYRTTKNPKGGAHIGVSGDGKRIVWNRQTRPVHKPSGYGSKVPGKVNPVTDPYAPGYLRDHEAKAVMAELARSGTRKTPNPDRRIGMKGVWNAKKKRWEWKEDQKSAGYRATFGVKTRPNTGFGVSGGLAEPDTGSYPFRESEFDDLGVKESEGRSKVIRGENGQLIGPKAYKGRNILASKDGRIRSYTKGPKGAQPPEHTAPRHVPGLSRQAYVYDDPVVINQASGKAVTDPKTGKVKFVQGYGGATTRTYTDPKTGKKKKVVVRVRDQVTRPGHKQSHRNNKTARQTHYENATAQGHRKGQKGRPSGQVREAEQRRARRVVMARGLLGDQAEIRRGRTPTSHTVARAKARRMKARSGKRAPIHFSQHGGTPPQPNADRAVTTDAYRDDEMQQRVTRAQQRNSGGASKKTQGQLDYYRDADGKPMAYQDMTKAQDAEYFSKDFKRTLKDAGKKGLKSLGPLSWVAGAGALAAGYADPAEALGMTVDKAGESNSWARKKMGEKAWKKMLREEKAYYARKQRRREKANPIAAYGRRGSKRR